MPASSSPSRGPRQILIVDDETMVVKTYHEAIAGHFPYDRIETASNGFDAVEAFRLHRHDIIIMDINMPVMDGRKAEYEIRMYCEEQAIPEPDIIFFTGYMPPDDMKTLIHDNPSCTLLLKPVAVSTLIKEIEKRLEACAAGDTTA